MYVTLIFTYMFLFAWLICHLHIITNANITLTLQFRPIRSARIYQTILRGYQSLKYNVYSHCRCKHGKMYTIPSSHKQCIEGFLIDAFIWRQNIFLSFIFLGEYSFFLHDPFNICKIKYRECKHYFSRL